MAKKEQLVIESYEQMMDKRRVPRSMLRHMDIFIGIAFIALPFITLGAYNKITLIGAGLGIVFMIVQRIVYKDPKTYADPQPTDGRKRACMIIRCIALVILLFDMFISFGWGSGIRASYPLRKALYGLGNYSDSKSFEFMPDSLPKKTEELKMSFVPPMAGQDAAGHIDIYFYTDDDGIKSLRDEALDKGGELCGEESFEVKKLRNYCEGKGLDFKGGEVYLIGKTDKHCPAYLINEESGLCVIYW